MYVYIYIYIYICVRAREFHEPGCRERFPDRRHRNSKAFEEHIRNMSHIVSSQSNNTYLFYSNLSTATPKVHPFLTRPWQ